MDKTKVNLSLDDTEQKVVSSASKKDDVATTETTSEPIATATEDIDEDDITNSDESTSEPNATTTEDIDKKDIQRSCAFLFDLRNSKYDACSKDRLLIHNY